MDKTTTSETRLSFSKIHPRHQIAWDSTSLRALKRCPRYYQYSIIEGYVSRIESVHLRFGLEYGNALTTYHKSRAAGQDHDTATISAVRYAMEHTWDSKLNRPWTSDEPTKNRETLLRSIIWYLDRFRDDSLQTVVLADGTAAVELPFRLHLEENSSLTDEEYLLCGYIDRLVKFMGETWITDNKTTKYALDERYFRQYSPDTQMSQYDVAGTIITSTPIGGVIIDAAQLGVTFSRFQRGNAKRTPAQREEWLRDSMIVIRQNECYVREDYWPMNDATCNMYNGCTYQEVCGSSPDIRPDLLKGLFVKRSWDPLVVREI